MNLRAILTFNAILAFAHGLGYVLAPSLLLKSYQIAVTPGAVTMGQLFGAELLFIAILAWKARDFTSTAALAAITLAGIVANSVGAVLCVMATLDNVTGVMGWVAALLYAVLAVGYLMIYLKKGYQSSNA